MDRKEEFLDRWAPKKSEPFNARNLFKKELSALLAEAKAEGMREVVNFCVELLEKRASDWRRKNVDEAKTDYMKNKTWNLAHEAEDCASIVRNAESVLRGLSEAREATDG